MSYLDNREYLRCSRCIMDTTIPEIRFDEHDVCQFCHIHDILEKRYALGDERTAERATLIEKIKHRGRRKKHDCIVGLSGGRDSTWTLYSAVQLGLKPLAVHFDNGWNSEIAVRNIYRATEKLGVELETIVADWHEFKDLQIAFLKASVPDVEVPTDLAIHSVLHRVASKEGIKYVLNGHSFRTEGIAPIGWTYFDGRYIKSVHKKFGTMKLKDFKNFGVWELLYYSMIRGIQVVPILNYAPYDEKVVQETLEKELDWQYYGGHHQESHYTKFIQTYLLPEKFNIDKRKTEYSALMRSGQMKREDALAEIAENPYHCDEELIEYSIAKLGLAKHEWDEIFNLPPRSFQDYPSLYPLMQLMKAPIRLFTEMGLLPELLYLKYLH